MPDPVYRFNDNDDNVCESSKIAYFVLFFLFFTIRTFASRQSIIFSAVIVSLVASCWKQRITIKELESTNKVSKIKRYVKLFIKTRSSLSKGHQSIPYLFIFCRYLYCIYCTVAWEDHEITLKKMLLHYLFLYWRATFYRI